MVFTTLTKHSPPLNGCTRTMAFAKVLSRTSPQILLYKILKKMKNLPSPLTIRIPGHTPQSPSSHTSIYFNSFIVRVFVFLFARFYLLPNKLFFSSPLFVFRIINTYPATKCFNNFFIEKFLQKMKRVLLLSLICVKSGRMMRKKDEKGKKCIYSELWGSATYKKNEQ